MSGNIPGGNFLNGNFLRGCSTMGSLMGGNFTSGSYPVFLEVFLFCLLELEEAIFESIRK